MKGHVGSQFGPGEETNNYKYSQNFESIIFISIGQMSRSTVALFMAAIYLFLRLTYFIYISVLYYIFKMYLLY